MPTCQWRHSASRPSCRLGRLQNAERLKGCNSTIAAALCGRASRSSFRNRHCRHRHRLAAANGQIHRAARTWIRRRHHRQAPRKSTVGTLGQARRCREPPRRGWFRRHRRLRGGARRPHIAVCSNIGVHGASVPLRQAALRSAGSGADRPGDQHARGRGCIGVIEGRIAGGIGGAGPRRTRQAQLGRHHRRARSERSLDS